MSAFGSKADIDLPLVLDYRRIRTRSDAMHVNR